MIHNHDSELEGRPFSERPVLFDGCETCDHRAKRGVAGACYLDEEHFMAMWNRMIAVEFTKTERTYKSFAEARMGKALYEMALLIERHPAIMVTVP